ncbi:MAG: 6,7-dimethyl-8-ribityllumazine synthase [Candidatus Omnitrophica bacterium]|nr:6,7-dimethyl-8-ribityllumazine synthase [Candidatus Omnitrophota bacterium]MDD5352818.1 6,7-dimethyl-8-ribityllumazine synthase [Candidatus Omnitrophota bacterium]MDD5550417.1 6,7-dimethyl-8-ribityllumazine synthase [Candidatus Omnitrophota bacterium]
MSKQYEAKLVCSGKKFAVVASRFNDFVTKELLGGCLDTLIRHGVKDNEVETFWVPGAFEIPTLANVLAKKKKYDAVICLGTIIRGATPHFDFIASEVSKGIASISMETGVPTIFGVITADTIEQAIERAGTKDGNKGRDAALSAIEMVNLLEEVK